MLWAQTDCGGRRVVVLLECAKSEARIMLRPSEGFWQIAIQRKVPLKEPGVVLFRVHR